MDVTRAFAQHPARGRLPESAPSIPSSRPGSLIDLDVLVISNALAAENATPDRWRLPTYPAFTTEEVDSLVDWIEREAPSS